MKPIDADRLVKDLKTLEPYNNKDVPGWVWSVIAGQPKIEGDDKDERDTFSGSDTASTGN